MKDEQHGRWQGVSKWFNGDGGCNWFLSDQDSTLAHIAHIRETAHNPSNVTTMILPNTFLRD